MGTAKPLASLSSGLLARKGQARPAMRPQGFSSMSGAPTPLEDLGWNDMGSPERVEFAPPPALAAEPVAPPPVIAEREALREQVETPPEPVAAAAPSSAIMPKPVSIATATRIRRESAGQTARGKAAFTLRLAADRHLRLRLASAVANESAQALVARALDSFLETMPEVETLVAQLPAEGNIR